MLTLPNDHKFKKMTLHNVANQFGGFTSNQLDVGTDTYNNINYMTDDFTIDITNKPVTFQAYVYNMTNYLTANTLVTLE